ncbi:hypothetical protein [Rhizobium sp. SL86]|uniref:hypothetical protein n=1 Tax=Rhizobium sp. SL86 TaxID=2995148 RepID=UPI0022722F04|nr:hypothetical protein [Rhizobium sp. SL86]MCY1668121.1 hypothetical protein [Rhizobium sp. SL86]
MTDTADDIHGILLSLHAISTYAVKAAAEYPISMAYGARIQGLAMESRSVVDAVQSALPLLFRATGGPIYDVDTAEVEELRKLGGWLAGLDEDPAEAYALAWFARLTAVLNEKLKAVLRWASEHELRQPARLVDPLLERLQWLDYALNEARAADKISSEQQRLINGSRNRP